MRKTITIAILLVMAGLAPAFGQSEVRDTVVVPASAVAVDMDDDEVVSSSEDLLFDQKTVRMSQAVRQQRGIEMTPSMAMHMPKDEYAKFFAEGELLVGSDVALGLHAAYVPKQWGFYGSYLRGVLSDWGSFGVVCRPVTTPAMVDWQLYCGPAISNEGIGFEAGMRLAEGAYKNEFPLSLVSGSVGVIAMNGYTYLTLGFSVALELFSIILL